MEAGEALLLELEREPAAACSGCECAASRHEKAAEQQRDQAAALRPELEVLALSS
jgi:hypothetical protein